MASDNCNLITRQNDLKRSGEPQFETEPVPCASTPEEPPAFTAADAAIALQIAAGSRPPDLRWDVSGDKRVTSLDALMSLQAAAGSTVRFEGQFGHLAYVDCK